MQIGFFVFFIHFVVADVPLRIACPAGCSCPRADTAICCLFPNNQAADSFSPLSCPIFNGQQVTVTTDANHRWPLYGSCSSNWIDLTVQLVSGGWPPSSPNLPCSGHLKRIAIVGAANDGLSMLNAKILRSLFFGNSTSPVLQSLTIEHTGLKSIESGLFDNLGTRGLTELTIRNNWNLNSQGLLISWLSETLSLKHLDISSNHLEELNFVRWGVASSSRLLTLILANNSLKHIDSLAFVRFPHLKELSLADNQLTSISLDMLKGLNSLERLDLSGNLLTLFGLPVSRNLPPFSLFLPHLTRLDLSSNPLMRGVKNPIEWWLSDGCPVGLTDLLLNYISVSPVTHGSYPLPTIAWSQCHALDNVFLFQTPQLNCLPSDWLQHREIPLSSRPKLLTAANSICSVNIPTSSLATTTMRPNVITPSASGFWNLFSGEDSSSNVSVQVLIICVVAGLFMLTIFIAIVSICMCYRRRHRKHPSKQHAQNQSKLSKADFAKNGLFDAPTVNRMSAYFPADCQLPSDGCVVSGESSLFQLPNQQLFSMQRSESRVLYNEQGLPVTYVVAAPASQTSSVGGEMHPLLLPDGNTVYYPIQMMHVAGRATPHFDQQSSAASFRGSQVMKPVNLPLLQQNQDCVTRCRPVAPNQQQFHALSCNSTSFSSLCGSVNSGRCGVGQQVIKDYPAGYMVCTPVGVEGRDLPQSEEPPSMLQQPLANVRNSSGERNSVTTSVSPSSPHSEEEADTLNTCLT